MPVDDAFDDATLCEAHDRETCEAPECLPTADRPVDDRDNDHARRVTQALDRERAIREARRILDRDERGPITIPAFETLRDRLARPTVPPRWRVHGWQPSDSRVMLAAQFKAGKTTFVQNYIRSLVDGDEFLGRDRVDAIDGSVVVLDLEMGTNQLDAWLRAQRIRSDDRVLPIPLRGRASALNVLDADVRRAWAARLREVQARVLILDCFRPLLDALGLDEHRDAGKVLVGFDALLDEAGIRDALIVHHMGHNSERARGDSRLRDWPDVEWRLMRQSDEPDSPRFVAGYGRDVDQPEARLVYDSLTRRLTIESGSRREAAAQEALDSVLGALDAAGEPLSGRAIKDAIEGSAPRDAIDAALRLGVRTEALQVEPGPRNSKLYRRSVRVSGSVRLAVSDTSSECPAALIEPDTRTLDRPSLFGSDGRTLQGG